MHHWITYNDLAHNYYCTLATQALNYLGLPKKTKLDCKHSSRFGLINNLFFPILTNVRCEALQSLPVKLMMSLHWPQTRSLPCSILMLVSTLPCLLYPSSPPCLMVSSFLREH